MAYANNNIVTSVSYLAQPTTSSDHSDDKSLDYSTFATTLHREPKPDE
jgi:hypothetical protein